ncbi:hypothetical protein M5X00_28380 [Paenibacillus alvei]|uniref:hypothetical protein n=1 Tax=Paenibacillus alvei TaxID=44250 RepID=UPI0002891349|nr:hypothetical protein [Paenibacillus alvei]EJW14429.1 hypothetical protein PAV_13c00480 [Paenibacillus alvei DSM 29]MCY9539204.1 hypothetical protein [Paenibacillus alvei]MCY9708583.1 hypothetical protein [Paenibacillus alvei]MCY9738109.1 hypothetical protein [Paenibacillus alvei]MCY9758145.1 hypothetical protein [Paenibacillus alvei]
MNQITLLERRLAAAERKTEQAAEARRNLGLGASRARVTTANARWSAAAEERDRVMEQLQKARESVER